MSVAKMIIDVMHMEFILITTFNSSERSRYNRQFLLGWYPRISRGKTIEICDQAVLYWGVQLCDQSAYFPTSVIIWGLNSLLDLNKLGVIKILFF
jgi:hypothetical protein